MQRRVTLDTGQTVRDCLCEGAARLIYWRVLDSPVGLSGISQRRHWGLLEADAMDGFCVCICVCLESVVHCWDIWLPPPGRKTVQYCRALPLLSLHTEMGQIFLALQHLTKVPAFNLIAKQANSSRELWVLKIKLYSQQILVPCRNVQVVLILYNVNFFIIMLLKRCLVLQYFLLLHRKNKHHAVEYIMNTIMYIYWYYVCGAMIQPKASHCKNDFLHRKHNHMLSNVPHEAKCGLQMHQH